MSDDDGAPRAPVGPGGGPLIRYPVDYPLKVIGPAGDDLADHVRALVLGAAPGVLLGVASVRLSSGGKYLAVTMVARLESEAQRCAIHAALQADPRVLYQL